MEKQLERIEIEDVTIGELLEETHGGNTKVWRAVYNGKEYALKGVIRDSIETHLELEHLMNERNALRDLEAVPVINKLVDSIKDPLTLYFLLEMVYGIPLHKLLRMRGKFSKKYTQLILLQVISGLDSMHEAGYIYRDLKASNVIVNSNGKVTIIDLGYAKKIGTDKTHSFCGTVHMIAPEMYNDDLETNGYDYAVDSYALGIFIYELLTGEAPFGYLTDAKERSAAGFTGDIKEKLAGSYPVAADLVEKLLKIDQHERLEVYKVLSHAFFNGVDIEAGEKIMRGEAVSEEDKDRFDITIYEEDIQDFGVNPLSNKTDEQSELDTKFNDLFAQF